MAQVKTKTIKSSDFRIRFEPNTLLRTKGGATTAFIYWQFGSFCFPGPRWSDFVTVISAWWIDALRSLDKTQTLRFMDGPYFITATRVGTTDVQIDCHEDREGKGLVESYRLPLRRVRDELIGVSKAVVAALRERNWGSRELELLNNLVGSPWPGADDAKRD